MRWSEIVGGDADAVVGEAAVTTGVVPGLPDDWQRRADGFRRDQERRGKLRQRVRDAEAKAQRQRRSAAERQWQANDRLRALRRELASTPAA